jgi:hypothetical protein
MRYWKNFGLAQTLLQSRSYFSLEASTEIDVKL